VLTDINIIEGISWGFIPARGGSKSVPRKNMAPFGGRPLIDYCVTAARIAKGLSRIFCSTENDEIVQHCQELGLEIHLRPVELSGDSTPLFNVISHFLRDMTAREGGVAEFIAQILPTSPFLLPEHIDRCLDGLRQSQEAASAQTVIACPHTHHAYNQRVVTDGWVTFRFPEERRRGYNKQTKPMHFLFGNVVAFRTTVALEQGIQFAQPSLAFEIPAFYGFDCDASEDFLLGEAMLSRGIVTLPSPHGWLLGAGD
jgi:CMP-N,N'-diacetyllegionaminic acid synthase